MKNYDSLCLIPNGYSVGLKKFKCKNDFYVTLHWDFHYTKVNIKVKRTGY